MREGSEVVEKLRQLLHQLLDPPTSPNSSLGVVSKGQTEATLIANLHRFLALLQQSVEKRAKMGEMNFSLHDLTDLNNFMEEEHQGEPPTRHILIIITYFIIATVAIIGNLLVVQLVIRSRRLHTLTHALLANLAVSDLLMATFNIPFSAARVLLTEWPFGDFLCQAVPFVQVSSVYVTSFTMAVIAMDRFQVIMNPLGKRMKRSQGPFLVATIWIAAALLALPFAIHHKVRSTLTVRIVQRCQSEFDSNLARQILIVSTFLAQYLIPLTFTTYSYVSIMQKLRRRSSTLGQTTPRQIEAQSRAKKKTIKMLVLTVIIFAICWAPINIYHLLTHFNQIRPNSTGILICHLIAMFSSCCNPFIYCWLNETFRREALKWLTCFLTRRSSHVDPALNEINGINENLNEPQRQTNENENSLRFGNSRDFPKLQSGSGGKAQNDVFLKSLNKETIEDESEMAETSFTQINNRKANENYENENTREQV